jgi:predicted transcriptional regulator
MKKKTSITLSPEVLAQVDKLAGPKHSRSAVIEQSLRRFWDSGPERVLSFAIWNSLTMPLID